MREVRIKLKDRREGPLLCGRNDETLKLLEEELRVKFVFRNDCLTIRGEAISLARSQEVIQQILSQLREGYLPETREIRFFLRQLKENKLVQINGDNSLVVFTTSRGRKIRPRTEGQKKYIETVRRNEVVFVIGPAGTGKTYLAVAMAMAALQKEQVVRLVLTRPTVEAGEKLGYLPGGLEEKIEPYLRPLYDAFYDLILANKFQSLLQRGIIEIASLAYMRGRTLNDAFIILDEAQNTTYEQMKMFLTRLGFGSKVVIAGDITQIDLSPPKSSGLVQVQSLFTEIKGIQTIYLTRRDVVRHRLVQEMVEAYESREGKIDYGKKSR